MAKAPSTKISSAYYKDDGTLKIGFTGVDVDGCSPLELKEIKLQAETLALKTKKVIQKRLKHFKIPNLSICLLVVGTQGDVQPFIALGLRLKAGGHRLQVAIHGIYRDLVTSHDLEFYPLGGDPKILSTYMVKTQGQLLPTGYPTITKDLPANMKSTIF